MQDVSLIYASLMHASVDCPCIGNFDCVTEHVVCEGGLKKDMKIKKEFKLEVHEAHGYKLKFQFVSA